VRPLSHSQQRQHFSCSYSPGPRRYTGRRTEHEAACQQRSKNLTASIVFAVYASFAIVLDKYYDVIVRLVLAVVMSRIDYCNTVLAGVTAATTEPLVRVQKAAARLVLQLGPRDECVTAAALAAHQSTNHI